LKINYRNTKQILQTANLIAADLLTADDRDDDGIPLLKPISCGREGQAPIIIKLPSLREEAYAIADQLSQAHKEGHAWGDMAILCADWKNHGPVCRRPGPAQTAVQHAQAVTGDFNPAANARSRS
jgi:superfamily I DNA/RNA helicase